MEMNEATSEEALEMLLEDAAEENDTERTITDEAELKEFVLGLVNGIWGSKKAVDDLLENYLKGWQMSRLSKVDRQILRLAAYEMLYRDDVPAKVAVNEAIELAKHFGTEDSGKFVNGVLGNMIRELDQLKS
ncbi:hypothetical protein BGX30_007501 [Mortierella sp. GBA39]|nr:hypothetical protein BGX30_007501 [Mortierella sp. GBA39]